MRVLPFTIPTVEKASFLVQEEKLKAFYPHLHRHKEIQICWVKKGKGSLIAKADFYTFKDNDIFIIASNCAHLFRNESNSDIECVSIFFTTDPEKNAVMKLDEMKEIRKLFSNIGPCHLLDNKVAKFIMQIQENNGPLRLSKFIDMLVYIKDQVKVDTEPRLSFSDISGDRIKRVIEYTIGHYQENIEIKNIADFIHYTPEAFCRFFKRRTGKSYIKYLNEYRINEVCRRLVTLETPVIGKLAYDCGFNSISHFNRTFKEQCKCSPLQFRSSYLKKMNELEREIL